MKSVLFALLTTLYSAAAFAPSTSKSSISVAREACISKEEVLKTPNTIEFGKVWDPAGLADLGSDETVAWFRHSEVKHGRIAMAAVRSENVSM